MKKSTAIIALGTLGGSAFLVGCRSNVEDGSSQYDDNSTGGGRSGGGYYGGFRRGRLYSSPRGGFGSTGGSSGRSGFFSGGG